MRTGSEIVCNLNSVCAALFARTCLRSRANYKGVAIEFAADECAKPLPDFKESRKEARKKPVQVSRGGNRFDALFADDGGEEGGDTDGDNDELVSVSTFTQDEDDCESSWADSTSTATEGGADLGNYWE